MLKWNKLNMAAYGGIIFIKHQITNELTKFKSLKKFTAIVKYFTNIQKFFLELLGI